MPRGARSFSPDRVSQVLAVVCISFPVLFLSCEENINPPVLEDQEFTIRENAPRGTIIGIIEATDPEPQQELTFRILSGNDDGAIALEPGTGSLTVEKPGDFDHEIRPQFQLSLQVRDVHLDSKADTATITILVADLPE